MNYDIFSSYVFFVTIFSECTPSSSRHAACGVFVCTNVGAEPALPRSFWLFSLSLPLSLSPPLFVLCFLVILRVLFCLHKKQCPKQWQPCTGLLWPALVLVLVLVLRQVVCAHFFFLLLLKPTIVLLAAFSIDRTNRNKAQPG